MTSVKLEISWCQGVESNHYHRMLSHNCDSTTYSQQKSLETNPKAMYKENLGGEGRRKNSQKLRPYYE